MGLFMIVVIGILLGIFYGCSLAFLVITLWVCKSNKLGDSKGTYSDFARRPMQYLSKKDSSRKMI